MLSLIHLFERGLSLLQGVGLRAFVGEGAFAEWPESGGEGGRREVSRGAGCRSQSFADAAPIA